MQRFVKFRCSPSVVLNITTEQIVVVDVAHIVSVGPFAADRGRSVLILDVSSSVQGPVTSVVDGSPDWVMDRIGGPLVDATDAPPVAELLPARVALPPRNGGGPVRHLEQVQR